LACHESMVQLANLRLEYLNTEGANALYSYLSQSTSLRHLTVSALDRDVTSIPFVAALRANGSLYSVSIHRVPLVNDITTSPEPSAVHSFSRRGYFAGEPPLPQSLFSVAEQSRVDAYITRNRMMSSIFERPLTKETNIVDNDVVDGDNAGQCPLHWTILPNIFGSAQAAARLAPHWTLHGTQQHITSTSTMGDETLDPSRKSTKRLL
jgi:hypothetical protein